MKRLNDTIKKSWKIFKMFYFILIVEAAADSEPLIKCKVPLKEPSDMLFSTVAAYFAEQGVTKEEVRQR